MVICERDAEEWLAGGAAENVRIDELLVFVVLLVDAGLESNEAVGFVLVESGVDGPGLGDELMELERQDRVARPGLHEGLVDGTDP